MGSVLRFVLGDQLTPALSALRGGEKAHDTILMAEVADEATYVPHHRKKIAFIFAAMRAFAQELRADGWQVDYVTLDDPANSGSFSGELRRAIGRCQPVEVVATQASEWRVQQDQQGWAQLTGLPVELRADDRFICARADFAAWAADRKQLRLEYFYREMRRKTGLLMDGDKPVGGKWNFDAENRKPASADLFMPAPYRVEPDELTRCVLNLVDDRFAGHFGDLEPFWFPVTRADAGHAVTRFITKALPHFGDYQDAMVRGTPFLYHSLLAPLINIGLVDPLDVCCQAQQAWEDGKAPLNAVEGFIRQIIGWREYVNGIYWMTMPGYTARNSLEARRPLPAMYWSGNTRMACMAESIGQTRGEAYAHHIQRLMITGNFALLAGIDPHALHEWYLSVYMDAYEWVEAPNTIGMSQFADGGLLASKPYAASGAYINRMSDYCSGCAYDVKKKSGKKACPFNALYWDFLARHRSRFEGHPRMAQMYRTYDRIDGGQRDAMARQAVRFLAHLDKHGSDEGWAG